MPDWYSLPEDIRIHILNWLAKKRHGKGNFAAVCKEWQKVIEKNNFHRLTIKKDKERGLSRLSPQRKALVCHIWLNVKLARYLCFDHNTPHQAREALFDRFRIFNHINKALTRLSTWPASADGLMLELSAYSTTDRERWPEGLFIGASGKDDRRSVTSKDPQHNLINPLRRSIMNLYSRCCQPHIFHTKFDEKSVAHRWPTVNAVTGFKIRRQCRRQLDTLSIGTLVDKFPRLEHLHLELWTFDDPQDLAAGRSDLVEDLYPLFLNRVHHSNFRRLTIFQDFCEAYIAITQRKPRRWANDIQLYHDIKRLNDEVLAEKSLDLAEVAISFVSDAKLFFSTCKPGWTWARLQSLVLTSELFVPGANPKFVSTLLQRAAQLALRMPCLQTLVLWNGRRGYASAFTYNRDKLTASITWCSTWDLDFDDETVRAWEEVARKHGECELWTEKRHLESKKILSHGHAIRLLELPPQVIDPVSRWQIEKEYEVENIPGVHRTPAFNVD
ncbi:hypothetical protein IL306_011009 [Fusarium sp. DS 682]|nr:hypothetical protein IL306_011009 [Fusarium sp. DS 682]